MSTDKHGRWWHDWEGGECVGNYTLSGYGAGIDGIYICSKRGNDWHGKECESERVCASGLRVRISWDAHGLTAPVILVSPRAGMDPITA